VLPQALLRGLGLGTAPAGGRKDPALLREISQGLKLPARKISLPVEEYLTIAEVAARLKIKPKTIKNKMAAGTFKLGIHYFRPPGMCSRFKWSAVVAWLEQSVEPANDSEAIPMPRSYAHRTGSARKPITSS